MIHKFECNPKEKTWYPSKFARDWTVFNPTIDQVQNMGRIDDDGL